MEADSASGESPFPGPCEVSGPAVQMECGGWTREGACLGYMVITGHSNPGQLAFLTCPYLPAGTLAVKRASYPHPEA